MDIERLAVLFGHYIGHAFRFMSFFCVVSGNWPSSALAFEGFSCPVIKSNRCNEVVKV